MSKDKGIKILVAVVACLILVGGFAITWDYGKYSGIVEGLRAGSVTNEQNIKNLQSAHEEQVKAILTAQEKQTNALLAAHKQDIENLQAINQQKMNEMEAAHQQEVMNLKINYEKQISDSKTANAKELETVRKEGYDKGYKEGQTSGPVWNQLHDPTYEEMQWFLSQDQTGNPSYNLNIVYNTLTYANTLKANAESQKIRCTIVYIGFPGNGWHVVIAFQTTNRGLIYVEPQNDRVVTLQIGQRYSQLNGFYYPYYIDDTIQRFGN